jgi:hypothetical protein
MRIVIYFGNLLVVTLTTRILTDYINKYSRCSLLIVT